MNISRTLSALVLATASLAQAAPLAPAPTPVTAARCQATSPPRRMTTLVVAVVVRACCSCATAAAPLRRTSDSQTRDEELSTDKAQRKNNE